MVLFLAVMAAAGYYVFNEAVAGGRHVIVPDVEGLDITEASYTLVANGLELGDQTPMQSDQVPIYHVISQRPPANKVVRAGRKVHLIVSAPQEDKAVPDVGRRALDEARGILESEGFVVGSLARIPSAAPRDTVVAQDPPAAQFAALESPVNLLLSAGTGGRGPLLMPDLVGRTVDDANEELAALGVRPRMVTVNQPDAAADTVVSQDPAANTFVQEGDVVTYYVNAAEPVRDAWRKVEIPYTVPGPGVRQVRIDVVGENQSRKTVFPPAEEVEAGNQSLPVEAGSTIRQPLEFSGSLTVEVYLDGAVARTYRFSGPGDPIITDVSTSRQGGDRAPTQNSPINPGF